MLSVQIGTSAVVCLFVFGTWFPIHMNPFHTNGTSSAKGDLVLKDVMN